MCYLQVSDRWCADYGVDRAIVIGRSQYVLFPENPDEWKEIHRRGLAGEIVRSDEDKFELAEGRHIYVRWEVLPWGTSDGGPEGLLIFSEDITASKVADESLKASRKEIAELLDRSPDAIVRLDHECRYLYVNAALVKASGLPREKLLGRTFREAGMPEALIETWCGAVQRVFETREALTVEFSFPGPQGQTEWEARDIPEFAPDGSVESVLCIMRDVTERSRSQAALRESAAMLQAISECARASIVVTDIEGGVLHANAAAVDLLTQMPLGQKIGLSATDRRVLERGRSEVVEQKVKQPAGDQTFLVSKSPRLDSKGKINGLIHVALDITDRKKAEAAAARDRRELRALTARLILAQEDRSREVAREWHDVFSQPLAVLGMDVTELKKSVPPGAHDFVGRLERVGEDINRLADGLHEISRHLHPAILDDLGLEAALHEECEIFFRLHGIPVVFEASDVPRELPQDIALCLYRVAQEILRNVAKHAEASEVRFRIAKVRSEIRLSVRDIGDGFELKKLKRKGLGLISMEERVRMVNGTFRIQSQPGSGTKVTVRIPLEGV